MDGNILKRRCKNITMYVEHSKKVNWMKYLRFTWCLTRFFEIENLVVFKNKIKELDFNLKLTKNSDSFTVTIDTNGCEMIMTIFCCVLSGDGCAAIPLSVHQVSSDLYGATISPDDFKSLKKRVLAGCGSIKLQFETGAKSKFFLYTNAIDRDYSIFRELKDSNDLIIKVSANFALKPIKGSKIYCAKSILAVRSKFFRNYFQNPSNNRDELSINTPFNSLSILVYYLYTGELYADELRVMLNLVKLAWELDIPSLKTKCATHIQAFITLGNVHQVRREGIENGLELLVENADYFLKNMGKFGAKRKANPRKRHK